MCKGYKKTCWIPSKKDLCGTCQNAKIADSPLEREPETLKFLRGNFDNIAYKLYKSNKHQEFLTKFNDVFQYRIYAHNETNLCPVYGWYLRNSEDSPMPNCLMCLAHALRYAKDKYVQSLILKSVVMLYDGPNMKSIMARAKHAKSPALYEFGLAIIEVQGIYGVFDAYIDLLDIPLAVKIQGHPILHKLLLTDDILKLRVYRQFKARKCKFYEELYAKAWHPSRFMHWCLDTQEKEGMDISPYLFQKVGSPWNIEW